MQNQLDGKFKQNSWFPVENNFEDRSGPVSPQTQDSYNQKSNFKNSKSLRKKLHRNHRSTAMTEHLGNPSVNECKGTQKAPVRNMSPNNESCLTMSGNVEKSTEKNNGLVLTERKQSWRP